MVGVEGQREEEGDAECVVHVAFLTLRLLQTESAQSSAQALCCISGLTTPRC